MYSIQKNSFAISCQKRSNIRHHHQHIWLFFPPEIIPKIISLLFMPNQLYRKKTPINIISNEENEINEGWRKKCQLKFIFSVLEKDWGFITAKWRKIAKFKSAPNIFNVFLNNKIYFPPFFARKIQTKRMLNCWILNVKKAEFKFLPFGKMLFKFQSIFGVSFFFD